MLHASCAGGRVFLHLVTQGLRPQHRDGTGHSNCGKGPWKTHCLFSLPHSGCDRWPEHIHAPSNYKAAEKMQRLPENMKASATHSLSGSCKEG